MTVGNSEYALPPLPRGLTLREDLRVLSVRAWGDFEPDDSTLPHLPLPAEIGRLQVGAGETALPLGIRLAPRRWLVLGHTDPPADLVMNGRIRIFDQSAGHCCLQGDRREEIPRSVLQRLIGPIHAGAFTGVAAAKRVRIGDIAALVVDDGRQTIRFMVRRSCCTAFALWLAAAAQGEVLPRGEAQRQAQSSQDRPRQPGL